MLKAGRAYHKYRVKRNCWPKVRGVAMNPVEHPHGGGNHQHIGHASTCRRDAPPGQKVCGFIHDTVFFDHNSSISYPESVYSVVSLPLVVLAVSAVVLSSLVAKSKRFDFNPFCRSVDCR